VTFESRTGKESNDSVAIYALHFSGSDRTFSGPASNLQSTELIPIIFTHPDRVRMSYSDRRQIRCGALVIPFEYLLLTLAGFFFLVLGYVAWLKFHEHLQMHRHDHDAKPHHHLAYVRRFRRRKRSLRPGRDIRK
jgi:hypothetical protein